MGLSQHPNLWPSNRTLANGSLLGTPCAEPHSYLHVIYIQHTSFYAGEILSLFFFLYKACRRGIYIAKQDEVWGEKTSSSGFGGESNVHDVPCVQLFNCFIRRSTGTRTNALMINTQVNIGKTDLNIA